MLKVKDIRLGTKQYSEALECVVTFQVGDQRYNTIPVKLPPEITRGLAELAVKKAAEVLTVVPTDFAVAGEPVIIPLIDEAPAPEFAEVPEPADFIPADVLREQGSDLGDPEDLKPGEAF